MDRENYYLLLELSLEPAEKDINVIEETVKKKQAQWSRYRNHPTKAIKSKQYIDMIPEIRRVMTDPELRHKEARDAKEILKEKETDKFEKIDRHIGILMSKGNVSKKEAAKLAKMHGIPEPAIRERIKKREFFFKIDRQVRMLLAKGPVTDKKIAALAKQYAVGKDKIAEWIQKKKEEIFQEIETYLIFCERRGFITEKAIIQLAHLYEVSEGEIHQRIKCPIRKGDPETEASRPTLDKTLETLIEDNLKIVGKSSLYDFLELPTDAPLSALQKKAKEKETHIRRIGQKDALVTAGGALAGHCIVIFRTKEVRNAYDLTRSRAHLTELNSDIDVAGIDGKIRNEYFNILVRRSLKINMDIEDAVSYIKEYCRKEKWVLKEKKKWLTIGKKKIVFLEKWTVELDPKKKSFWVLCGAGIAALFIVISSVMFAGGIIRENRIKSAWQNVLTTVKSTQSLENKEKVLQDFVNRYSDSKYAGSVKKQIGEVRKEIEKRDWEATVTAAESLFAEKNFEKAKTVYNEFLGKYPKSDHSRDVKKKLAEIPLLIENRDYERLKADSGGDFVERIKAYNGYFKNHPDGAHVGDVKKMIAEMIGEYYSALKKDLSVCESQQDWEKCIQLCDGFIEKFQGTEPAVEAEGFQVMYRKRIQYKADLDELKKRAEEKGTDFEAAKTLYAEYMLASPEAPVYVKELLKKELTEWERRRQRYIQEEKEWDELFDYCNEVNNTYGDRADRLEAYISRNPGGRHIEEAEILYQEMSRKRIREDKYLSEKREDREWVEIVLYSRNIQVSLTDRVNKMEEYIRKNASSKYIREAGPILAKLKADKAVEEGQIKSEKEMAERRQNEMIRIRALAKESNGRFAENGNGTVSDKKTGRMWTTLDVLSDSGRCVEYEAALAYVKNLRTGGYADWRLPTTEELVAIYKNPPFFPSSSAKWFWSSDVIWHGWNKKVDIVTSKRENAWNKTQVDLRQCGSVRAVRP